MIRYFDGDIDDAIKHKLLCLKAKEEELDNGRKAELVANRILYGWSFAEQSNEDHDIEREEIIKRTIELIG